MSPQLGLRAFARRAVSGLVVSVVALLVAMAWAAAPARAGPVTATHEHGSTSNVDIEEARSPGYRYDYRPDSARPPPVGAVLHAYDTLSDFVDPAAYGARLLRAFSASDARPVAPNSARPSASSVIDDVMAETRAGAGNLTSKYSLTADEALTAGERWVGSGYTELGKPGSGVFRSADGTRQFRIDNGSITGAHSPGVPHVHLETISPGSKVPVANNHIPFTE